MPQQWRNPTAGFNALERRYRGPLRRSAAAMRDALPVTGYGFGGGCRRRLRNCFLAHCRDCSIRLIRLIQERPKDSGRGAVPRYAAQALRRACRHGRLPHPASGRYATPNPPADVRPVRHETQPRRTAESSSDKIGVTAFHATVFESGVPAQAVMLWYVVQRVKLSPVTPHLCNVDAAMSRIFAISCTHTVKVQCIPRCATR
jgi:hypothetical protein